MNKISSGQLFFLMFMVYNNAYGVILPYNLAQTQALGVIGVLLLCAAVGEIVIFLALRLGKDGRFFALKSQNASLWQKCQGVILSFFYLAIVIIAIDSFCGMLETEFLRDTPKGVLLVMALVPLCYLALHDLINIAWLSVMIIPLSLVAYVIAGIGNMDNFCLMNILPLQIQYDNFFRCFLFALPIYAQSFILAQMYPYLRRPENAFKISSLALWGHIGLLLAQQLLAYGVFGAIESERLLFIPFELMGILTFGQSTLRIEALAIWHWLAMGVLGGALFFNGIKAIWLGEEKMKGYLPLVLGAVIWIVLVIFDDLYAFNFLARVFGRITAGVIIILIFWRRSKVHEK